jgi:hypothetical protein
VLRLAHCGSKDCVAAEGFPRGNGDDDRNRRASTAAHKRKLATSFNMPGIWFWRRPIDSFAPAHSAAAATLTVHPVVSQPLGSLTICGPRPRRASSRTTTKCPAYLSTCRAFSSGDVLLSHDLASHYHRGCSVSLPCSEWERVGPLRDNHQNFTPHSSAQNSGA